MAKQVDVATSHTQFTEFHFRLGAHAHACGHPVQNGRDCGDTRFGQWCYYHNKIAAGLIRPSG